MDLATEFTKTVTHYGVQVLNILKNFTRNLWQTIHDNILPPLLEFLSSLREIGNRIFKTGWSFLQRILKEFNTFFGKYQEDFNKILKQVGEQLRDLYSIAVKFTGQLRAELENIINSLLNFIKETLDIKSFLNRIGAMLKEYKYETYVNQFSHELSKYVKEVQLLTTETKSFLEALIKYVTSRLTNLDIQNTDAEFAEIKQLGKLFVEAVKSVYTWVKEMVNEHSQTVTKSSFYTSFKDLSVDSQRMQDFFKQNFVALPIWSPLGVVTGDLPMSHLKFQWSGLNYLFSGEFYKSLFQGDWSRLWEFGRVSNIIPPYTYQAQIIDGAHFMTFDGLHYTFAVSSGAADASNGEPEGCYFVLAADSQHSNFTIVGTFNNKLTSKLNSIIIFDQSNNVFELKANDKVYYNNKPKELPLHQEFSVWRNYYGQTEIYHPYGVEILCERHLELCTFTVNGFYKNKLRGLLGNANDEKVDELQLQNGEFVETSAHSYEPFYQNYQLKKFNKQCPKLVTVTGDLHGHDHHAAQPECDTVFKNFAYFEKFLPWFDNYKEACAHAVSIAGGVNKQELACTISRGFVRKLRSEYNIPVQVPTVCHKVSAASDKDTGLTKVVNKKLDLVLLVDFNNTAYIELIGQLMGEFKTTMKQYQITDPVITLVGYNKDWKYPIHLSTVDAKLNIPETTKTMPLRSDSYFRTRSPDLNQLIDAFFVTQEKVETELGLSSDAQAFQYAFQYPFRADAIKSIFVFRSDPLKYGLNPVKTVTSSFINNVSAARGIQTHLLAPVEDFTLSGSPTNARNAKQVIGFNQKTVIQNSDSKKRANVGATNLRQHVQFKADLGTDLVLSSNDGNNYVFILQNYQQRNPKDKKVFVQAMANVVTEQMPRLAITQTCHYDIVHGLYERDVCLVKDVQFLAPVSHNESIYPAVFPVTKTNC